MPAYDFRRAEHLPNLRPEGRPPSPEELPRQRNGVTPQMHGRYPDYNVLDEADHWDPVTRRMVFERVEKPPPIRFFTGAEAATVQVFCDLVLAQDREPKIPVLNMVDAKLFAGELDGFRYADMPDDRETWRRLPRGLDAAARQHGCPNFVDASEEVQRKVIDALAHGELHGEVWDELPPSRTWKVVTRAILSAFYSHPWAWNEIGFGGPAYPRGYARFGLGQRESWEGAPAFERDPVKDTQG
ncbi:MAG: gluconate 2-dehydrogenase subunit 3 family protein [Solirubrobacterales bacterium]|nr:gluconate 2-dehydrogenase subunit 3 family protein [Solirubrobacterales bacterium]MBV9715376.1 gluconate 2-dehydrogenase subunit 3 family protein [Solirubrobacterales bacterium]